MILLLGGAGYIGTHTAIALLNKGYNVVIIDNFSNSKPAAISRVELITGKSVTVFNEDLDIPDSEILSYIHKNYDIEGIINLAGYKAVGESVRDPIKYYWNNLMININILKFMNKNGLQNYIFSSSATVYDTTADSSPYSEGCMTGNCTNPYGWTKYMNEQIIRDTTKAFGIKSILLRYFNPIGAHESGLIGEDPNGIPNNLLPYVANVAVRKLPILSVYGNDYPTKDGTGVRDYIHVMDLAEAHVKALEYSINNDTDNYCDVFNIGTGTGYSVLDIITNYQNVNNVTIPYKYVDRRPGDVATCYSDPTRANEVLGWKATRDLKTMLKDHHNWQIKNPDGYPD